MSLRARLVLAAAYLLAVIVVALEIPLALNISRRATSEFQSAALGRAAILASQVSDDVAHSDLSKTPPVPPAVATNVGDLARRTNSRIIVVDEQGRILSDSAGTAPIGTFYVNDERPELTVAINGRIDVRRRHSDTLGQDLLLVTVPILHNGVSIGAVRVSQSLEAVTNRIHRSWLGLGAIGLAVIAAGLGLAWFLAASLSRPVERLHQAAVRLGQGDLDARASAPEGPREIRTLADAFNLMASTLSANVQAQRDFLANASHQLRTPLTGLRLRLEAVEAEGGPAAEQARKAQIEVDRLSQLVEDLLELARASSVEVKGERVDLAELAREAVDRWTEPIVKAGKELAPDIHGPAWVWADPEDVGHVVDNLIENSIRYTPAGTTISVKTSTEGRGVSLEVSDDGPGIPPEDRERIFERFYRGSTGKKTGPGTGLGLAIVAQLVERWNGTIQLQNREGTCIEAKFPVAQES